MQKEHYSRQRSRPERSLGSLGNCETKNARGKLKGEEGSIIGCPASHFKELFFYSKSREKSLKGFKLESDMFI